jgi:predicted nucleic acid-binding protein
LVTIDASVALAWLLDESRPPWVDGLLDDMRRDAVRTIVPSLFWLEVGNTISRLRTISDEQALDGLLRLDELGIATIELDRPSRARALLLARETGLSMYHAVYLALAETTGTRLATLDERLVRAGSSRGLEYPPGASRVSETENRYGGTRTVDPVSLAAVGSAIAELRRQYAPS